ncbi:MAG: oligosaccharide flippase family protein [Betaproteobacteria bacterium]|nr:oligosaccharide flippase family protein [Betaproteobacteria bacterium]
MAAAERKSLKQRALRAGAWSAAGYGLSQVIRLGSNLIMTRLLVPEMFGVMAIATMVTVVLGLLSDIGLRPSIVQSRRGEDPVFLDSAWILQIARGFALWLAAALLSVALYAANMSGLLPGKSVYASPVLPLVIVFSSFSAVISGFQSMNMATAQRNFDQKRLNQIALFGQLAGLVVMIAIGVATRSIWALVAGGLVSSLVTTVLSHTWMSGHRNRFRWEREALRELIGFGKWVFVSSGVYVLAASGDRILLGAFVDAHVLGLYAIAVLIVGAIEGGLTRLFSIVSLPALSEIARNEPARLREVYYRMRIPGDLLLLFAAGLLFGAGQLVIDVLYDRRYAEAGGMLQVLGLSLFTVRFGVAHQIYLALARPRNLAIINAVRCVALYALVPLCYFAAGTSAAIWAVALHALATVPFIYFFNARLGLIDVRRELLVLPAFLAGYVFGLGLIRLWPW